jgi:hypothetical protein
MTTFEPPFAGKIVSFVLAERVGSVTEVAVRVTFVGPDTLAGAE